jgi:hypothetical protein
MPDLPYFCRQLLAAQSRVVAGGFIVALLLTVQVVAFTDREFVLLKIKTEKQC